MPNHLRFGQMHAFYPIMQNIGYILVPQPFSRRIPANNVQQRKNKLGEEIISSFEPLGMCIDCIVRSI